MINPNFIIQELERNRAVFHQLLAGVPEKAYHWRPNTDKWNLLEIICHLYDEEREDFRARLRLVLDTPNEPFTGIDPQGWVSARNYAGQDFEAVLKDFLAERVQSVTWLRSLGEEPAWDNVAVHPKLGPMSARLFLNNWLAHDYLHLRQIAYTKHNYLKHNSGESLAYAGDW